MRPWFIWPIVLVTCAKTLRHISFNIFFCIWDLIYLFSLSFDVMMLSFHLSVKSLISISCRFVEILSFSCCTKFWSRFDVLLLCYLYEILVSICDIWWKFWSSIRWWKSWFSLHVKLRSISRDNQTFFKSENSFLYVDVLTSEIDNQCFHLIRSRNFHRCLIRNLYKSTYEI